MTEDDKDTEVGRTIREYQEQSDRLGCLVSKLHRLGGHIENIQNAIVSKSSTLTQDVQTAAQQVGDISIHDLLMEIAKADAAKRRLYGTLQDQGVGHLIREDRAE